MKYIDLFNILKMFNFALSVTNMVENQTVTNMVENQTVTNMVENQRKGTFQSNISCCFNQFEAFSW